VQVEFVGEREKIEGAESSSLLVLWEYVDAGIVEEEEGVRRRGIGMASEVCFPSLMLGNCCRFLNWSVERIFGVLGLEERSLLEKIGEKSRADGHTYVR